MRTHAIRFAVALGAAWFLAACGGDDDDDGGGDRNDGGNGGGGSVTCEELAAIVGDCGGELTEEEFLAVACDIFVLSDDCLEEAADADCDEHDEPVPSYQETCFPSCSDTESECQGDAIRVCDAEDQIEILFRCDTVCSMSSLTYTGTCANEFEGTPSNDGQDVCWCE